MKRKKKTNILENIDLNKIRLELFQRYDGRRRRNKKWFKKNMEDEEELKDGQQEETEEEKSWEWNTTSCGCMKKSIRQLAYAHTPIIIIHCIYTITSTRRKDIYLTRHRTLITCNQKDKHGEGRIKQLPCNWCSEGVVRNTSRNA